MISFFRIIRQKLLEDEPSGQPVNKIASYFKFANGEILLLVVRKICPFRDLTWVEKTISQAPTVPLGTGYVGNPKLGTNDIAYLPTGQAGLRHAIPDYKSVFYRYFVPRTDRDLRPTGHLQHNQ